jgi:hypothetical protein
MVKPPGKLSARPPAPDWKWGQSTAGHAIEMARHARLHALHVKSCWQGIAIVPAVTVDAQKAKVHPKADRTLHHANTVRCCAGGRVPRGRNATGTKMKSWRQLEMPKPMTRMINQSEIANPESLLPTSSIDLCLLISSFCLRFMFNSCNPMMYVMSPISSYEVGSGVERDHAIDL